MTLSNHFLTLSTYFAHAFNLEKFRKQLCNVQNELIYQVKMKIYIHIRTRKFKLNDPKLYALIMYQKKEPKVNNLFDFGPVCANKIKSTIVYDKKK